MSRIGRKEIDVPDGVTVSMDDGRVSVAGKLGHLDYKPHAHISVERDGNTLRVIRASDKKFDKSLHGLSRTLIQNMIVGVSQGFERVLMVQGVGYRFEIKSDKIVFNVGYSHPVEFQLPEGISAEEVDRNTFKLKGIDKELIGLTAARIRAIRSPDSYKGKGIRYKDERIKLKPGKSGGK